MTGPGHNRRLLVIDDEAEIRQGYRGFLNPERLPKLATSRGGPSTATEAGAATYDFELSEAESGDRALELVRSELAAGRRFAGAIVDVRMPGRIDGLEFLKEAWAIDPDLLVVVVTAYQDRSVDDISRMFGERFQDQWDYLSKPFTSGEIVQKARNLVSSWNRRERERIYLKTIQDQQSALIAQEQLAAVGRIARSVGHDLGNILQQVLTKVDLLENAEETGLAEAVELGATICRDLLMFGRPSKEAPPAEPVALVGAIAKASRLLRQQLKRRDIRLNLELDEVAGAFAHETRLVQVFVNLMTNAIQATPEGGELRLIARKEKDGSSTAEVTDTGQGISPTALPHIFEPLYSTKGEGGNGLGLVICKRIVEEAGGTISIDSAPGRGTTVRLRFPGVRGA